MSSRLSSKNQVTTNKTKNFNIVCRRKEPEVKLPSVLSREGVVSGLKKLGKLRPRINHSTIITFADLAAHSISGVHDTHLTSTLGDTNGQASPYGIRPVLSIQPHILYGEKRSDFALLAHALD